MLRHYVDATMMPYCANPNYAFLIRRILPCQAYLSVIRRFWWTFSFRFQFHSRCRMINQHRTSSLRMRCVSSWDLLSMSPFSCLHREVRESYVNPNCRTIVHSGISDLANDVSRGNHMSDCSLINLICERLYPQSLRLLVRTIQAKCFSGAILALREMLTIVHCL